MVKGSNVPGNIALLISRYIFFYNKVFNYKVLSFHGILTHIEFQQFFHQIGLSGEISPSPLNRVISGLGLNRSIAAILSSSE